MLIKGFLNDRFKENLFEIDDLVRNLISWCFVLESGMLFDVLVFFNIVIIVLVKVFLID